MLPFSLNLFYRPSLTTLTRMRVGGEFLTGSNYQRVNHDHRKH